jgi:tetratricopeptide (TPR) repeat protein
MVSEEPHSPEYYRLLYEQILAWKSMSDARCWIIRHLPDLTDDFLQILDSWALVDFRQAEHASRAANFIRPFWEEREDIHQQSALLKFILQNDSPSDQHNKLKNIIPEITHNFFRVLSCWADENKRNHQSAVALCRELLDLIEFNDLREDWPQREKGIIWGVAWFIRRDDIFSAIIDSRDNGQLLDYWLLEQSFPFIFHLQISGRLPNLALAILNVLLELSPRAVSGIPPVSMEYELRFLTLGTAGKVIYALGGQGSITRAKRVLQEAFTILNEKITSDPTHTQTEYRLSIDANAAAALDLMGDFELADNNPQEAIRIYTQALGQHKTVAENAGKAGVLEKNRRKMTLGIANSLWRLGTAEMRLGKLDDAYSHIEQAISQYFSSGLQEFEMIEYFQLQARIEFLRTNFDKAESLLNKVMQLKQEGRSDGQLSVP